MSEEIPTWKQRQRAAKERMKQVRVHPSKKPGDKLVFSDKRRYVVANDGSLRRIN